MAKGKFKRKNQKRPSKNASTNPSSALLKYNGPLNLGAESLSSLQLVWDLALTSTAGGIIDTVIGDTPNQSPDWTNVAATFAEYRILAMQIHFTPNVFGATEASTNYAPLYIVWSADSSATALTSYAGASNYDKSTQHALNQPWTRHHRMSGVEEGEFVATSSNILDYTFKLFATGLTVSKTYGRLTTKWLVQFRGRL